MTIGELIEALGGVVAAGLSTADIDSVGSTANAGAASLVFAEDAGSAQKAFESNAGAVVVAPGLGVTFPAGKAVVEVSQPRLWFARAARLLDQGSQGGVHPTAVVGEGVTIGVHSRIDAGVVVGEGVTIGRDCHLYPRVVLYPGTTLGDRVIVHAGAVLGADGFGYVRDKTTGAYTQFPQQGRLVIEDDVEIGANSTIDRGALEETRIRRGTKIDNLVHVGHNCDIGEDVILVMGTGISGSSTVGKGAVLAGQVGIGDHAHVGPGVILGGQAGVLSGKTVTNDGLKPGTVLWGTPARPLKQVLREIAALSRLARGRGRSAKGSDE